MENSRTSLWVGCVQAFELLILARVPLLLVFAGAVMVYYVPQFQELFDLALKRPEWALWVWLFTGALSLAAWYSARTLFSFEWPRRVENPRVQKMLGKLLPRLLAGLLPAIMALAFWLASSPGSGLAQGLWVSLFIGQAVALLLFTTYRRPLIRNRFVSTLARPLGLDTEKIEAEPAVGRLRHWSDLGPMRYFHLFGIAVLISSGVIGHYLPHWIDLVGSPGLVLGALMMLIWASTAPVYWASRKRVPLVTALIAWATLMTLVGWNDNHAVRLTAGAHSDQDPPPGLVYSAGSREPLSAFMAEWWDAGRREHCDDQAYFVSSAGGGIRAALWTVLVLSELQRETDGRFWDCTMAVSGVSGGSLGLASFAAYMREQDDMLAEDDDRLVRFLEDDFLAPVLAAMFGTDLLQRFLPVRMFTDRGQALEDSWVRGYRKHVLGIADAVEADAGMAAPLADSVRSLGTGRWRTALFLNTTLVDSGLRLIQHPFSALDDEADVSAPFPGAKNGANWLPEELPLFSAVHNSARFTLVSPAGTILRREEAGETVRLGQVVDGGYFENSGATTIRALIDGYREVVDAGNGPARFRVIHISNGDSVEPFALNGADKCSGPSSGSVTVPLFGEVRAPLIAILRTRDARGQFARQALLDRVQQLDGKLWHYRLCNGLHPIPLGWTIGGQVTREMRRQLSCGSDPSAGECVQAARMGQNTREIVAQWADR